MWWIIVVLGIMVCFYIWSKLGKKAKVFVAIFAVLAAPFTEYISFVILCMILILDSMFGRFLK